MNFHAVSHSLPHRGPGATRTRTRWQPYASNVTLPASQRSPTVYLHTPASSTASSTPSTVLLHPTCDLERLKFPVQPHTVGTPLRDAQKTKYAAKLVDQAVKTLCETWHPDDIPTAFTACGREALCAQPEYTKCTAESSTSSPMFGSNISTTLFSGRNTQLPSPVTPTSWQTPSPPGDRCESYSQAPECSGSNLVPIKGFVHEVLRRSRTSTGVLQTALCYLEAVRTRIPDLLRSEKACPTSERVPDDAAEPRIVQAVFEDSTSSSSAPAPADTPAQTASADAPTIRVGDTVLVSDMDLETCPETIVGVRPKDESPLPPLPPLPSPLCCPRRTFLACLILASKFMQDRSYSNRAWAKLAGLPPREIGRCERALGEALEWRLWVGKIPTTSTSGSSSRLVSRSRSDGDILCGPPRTCSKPSTAAWAASPTAHAGPLASCAQAPARAPAPPKFWTRSLQRSSTVPVVGSDRSTDSNWAAPTHYYGTQTTTTPGPGYDTTFTMDVEPLLEVSPSLSTPTLSYSPMSTASSSSDGSEDQTIQMSVYMDMPTPSMMTVGAGNNDGPWIANASAYTPADPTNSFGSFGSIPHHPYYNYSNSFVGIECEGAVGPSPTIVSPTVAKIPSVPLLSFSEYYSGSGLGAHSTGLQ